MEMEIIKQTELDKSYLGKDRIKEIYLKKYQEILERFNQENVGYCVLRNYEFALGLDYPLERHFDMVIKSEDMEKVAKIFKEFHGIKYPPQFSLVHQGHGILIPHENLKVGFDIQNGGIHWNDIPYLSADQVIKRRIKKGFFYVLSKEDDFIMYLCHSILGKRGFKKKYQQILFNLSNQNLEWDYIDNNLSNIFNKKIAQKLISLVKNNDFKKIDNLIFSLVLRFIFKNPTNIWTFSKLSWRWFFSRRHTPLLKIPFIRFFVPGTPLISVIGPDGSGKSTMANNLLISMKERFHTRAELVYSGRGNQNIIPIKKVGDIYKKIESAKKIKDNHNDVKNNFENDLENKSKNKHNGYRKKTSKLIFKIISKTIYTLSSPIYTLDLLLRYYFSIMPKRVRHTFVITDRYCSDLLLMNNVPFLLKRFFISLFPKPTLTFYLYNDLETLSLRRPNHSVNDLKRQLKLFEYLKKSFNAVSIKTSDPQKDFDKVSEIVFRELIRRGY